MGAELRRVAVALVALGMLASCSHHNPAPPSPDGSAGRDGATETKPKVDGGTDAQVDACVATGAPQIVGAACGCNAQCASGFCVENVCCATACTGGCNTCTATDSVGTCVKRPAGADPRKASDCPMQTPETCGLDGACDGSGACRHYLGATCVGGTCNGDAVVGAYACDGTGQCKPGVTMLCLPFTCDLTQGDPMQGECYQHCSSNAECTAGQACDFATGSCGQGGPGAHCDTDAECISTFCADHVCCNVACGVNAQGVVDGACVACNLPGRLGTCWPVDSGKPDPRGVCTDKGEPSCGHNGTCDGVGGCANYVQDVQCLAPTCTGNRLNTAGTCDGLGTCRPPGVQDCHPFKCVDGACTNSCQTDKDCDSGTACVNNTCGPKPLGFACAGASECASSQCVDGVCCESACTGACRSCDLPTSPGRCMTIAAGNPDPRNVCADKGAAACNTNGLCDGTGSCDTYPVGTVCASETCTSGLYTPASTCSMDGQCVAPDSRACIPYVCNGTQCFNACATNDQCKPPNTCSSTKSCGLKTNGAACGALAECASGFCAQGICCNSACGGTCQSCALINALGTCTNVPVNSVDPAVMCTDKGAASCGTNGKCNGNGSCQKYVQGTTCVGSSCPSGTTVFTGVSTCDGAGTCVTPGAAPCFPYQCGVNVCKNSCTSDADCASPAVCNGGSCGLKSNGQTCATAVECSSGFCSQATCCATACQGACQSCALTTAPGTCTNVINGAADPQATCHDAGNASCGTDGFCNGSGACRLYAGGTSCAAPVCPTGGSTLTSGRTCDGNGNCQGATTIACAPYLCNGSTACKAACSADADCLAPDICDPATNHCGSHARLGQACTTTNDCLTNDSCVDGVCCSSSSCGTCQACNVPGSAGNCAPVAANAAEPHTPSLCNPNPPCGNTGACNGAGACQLAGTSVSCGTQSCAGSTLTPVSHCSGSGSCAAPTSSTCSGGFVCDTTNNVCKTTCTADGDCVAPLTCQGSGSNKSCARKPGGQACTGGSQCLTGFCTDGVCCGSAACGTCQACNVNGIGSCSFIPTGTTAPAGQCPAGTTCGNTGACNGAGACQQASTSVPCSGPTCSGATFTAQPFCSGGGTCAPPAPGNCGAYVCGSATACKTTCGADTDCVGGDYCTATSSGNCVPQKAPGATCVLPHECASGNCVDGVCCTTSACSTCQACNVNGSGTCANVTGGITDPHSRCTVTSTCGNTGACNGSGACTQAATSVGCAAAFCTAATNIFTPAVSCTGSGTCAAPTTRSCAPYICGANACTTTCTTDTGSTGCATGNYCTSSGSCAALKGSGAACGAGHECGSGNCVDGVCCGSGSCPTCQACNVSGSPGTCTNVGNTVTDPHSRCPVSTTCGNTGTCNGSGACTQASTSVMCGNPACSGTTFTPPVFCSGSGSCPSPTTSGCGEYVCASSGTACNTSCTADTDCIGGDYCTSTANGTCMPKNGLGVVCGGNHECSSTNCVDGVCCSTSACNTCQACNVNGTGICANVTSGLTDPHSRCAVTSTCGNTGACNAGACAQAGTTVGCSSPSCSGTLFIHAQSCSGSGTCPTAASTDCFPYLCTTSSPGCPGHCSSDGDCVAGDYCTNIINGTCQPRGIAGSPCSGSGVVDQCGTGLFCTDGVCCTSMDCTLSCTSCAVPTLEGSCSNVQAGSTDPTGTCQGLAQDPSTCGGNGLCNATGGCQDYGTSTVCMPASCSTDDSTFTPASLCDGGGNCVAPVPATVNCPTQMCDGTMAGCQ